MPEPAEKFTLLLVDDNPTNLLLLEKIIELDLPQVRVVSALSAEEGLELSVRHPVDGALIDVQMPRMDGLQMCRRLRANPRTARIPLVLMTAHVSAPELRAEGLAAGAYDFISQPIDNIEMLARMKVMLRLCETERRLRARGEQLSDQPEAVDARLRWLGGLLLSGQGEPAELDQDWLLRVASGLPSLASADREQLYDHLTDELPPPWRRTLLKLSLLDAVPLALVRDISEIPDVDGAISYLQRQALLELTHSAGDECLLLPPPSLELLRRKARQELSLADRQQVYRMAVSRFRQQQNYHQVLACLMAAEDYAGLSQFISQVGLEPFLTAPDGIPLALIDGLCEEKVASCGWLSLLYGVNRLYRFAADADLWLELASQQFLSLGDSRGALLARSAQILQNYYVDGHWDAWQERFEVFRDTLEQCSDQLGPAERLEVIFALGTAKLAFSGHPSQLEEVLNQTENNSRGDRLWRQQMKLQVLRTRFALHQGRLLLAHSAFEQGVRTFHEHASKVSDFERLILCMTACEILQATGNLAELQQQNLFGTCCGSALQRRTLLDGVLGYSSALLLLAAGQFQQAADRVDATLLNSPAAATPHLQSLLLQLRGWLRALGGDRDRALMDSERGMALRTQAPGGPLALESLLLAAATSCCLGRYPEAGEFLVRAQQESEQLGEERLRLGVQAWLAVVARQQGRKKDRTVHLRSFFELLRRHRCPYFPGLSPDLLEQLLAMADAADRQLLAPLADTWLATRISPRGQPVATLFVDCLGGFVLRQGENRFDMHQLGQGSRQILAALLMAPAGTVSTDVIMGTLWPDSPPAKARNNFDTAHSRLRRALEDVFGRNIRHDYLILDKGMLLLRNVRIDAVQFQEGMKTANYHLHRENDWQAEQALWSLQRLWQGEFLSGYDLGEEMSRYRDHLNQMRLEQLDQLARLLLGRRQTDEACRLLRIGLALEPTQDSMVRRLLKVYRQQQDYSRVNQLLSDYRQALQQQEYIKDEIDEMMESL